MTSEIKKKKKLYEQRGFFSAMSEDSKMMTPEGGFCQTQHRVHGRIQLIQAEPT